MPYFIRIARRQAGQCLAPSHCAIACRRILIASLVLLARARRSVSADQNPPKPLMARDVLYCATMGGAHYAGLDNKIGSLAPGKEADIIMIRVDDINLYPPNNAVARWCRRPTAAISILSSSAAACGNIEARWWASTSSASRRWSRSRAATCSPPSATAPTSCRPAAEAVVEYPPIWRSQPRLRLAST